MNPSIENHYMNMALAKYDRDQLLQRSDINVKNWWGDDDAKQPATAYRRFLDIYRLVCEEAYTTEGEAVGSYAEHAGGSFGCNGDAYRFFFAVLACAMRLGYLPEWFTIDGGERHISQLLAYANFVTSEGKPNVLYATEVRDVRNQYGYRLGTKLRIVAARIDAQMNETDRRHHCFHSQDTITPETEALARSINDQEEEDKKMDGKLLGNGFSRVSILDHLIQNADGSQKLTQMVDLYVKSMNYMYYPASRREGWLKQLKQLSNLDKNPMAMYLYGKQLGDKKISGDDPAKKLASMKLWTAAAFAGNAYAMAGLAMINRDAGHIFTAIQWWKNALKKCFVPEASYNIGVFYGHGEDSICPLDYTEAAHFYAHTVDWKLEKSHAELHFETCGFLLVFGPNNDEQEEYIPLAQSNLRYVEKRLAQQEATTRRTILNAEPNLGVSCAVCGRVECEGETKLLTCARCNAVRYCNSICQKGHWSIHKLTCGTVKEATKVG